MIDIVLYDTPLCRDCRWYHIPMNPFAADECRHERATVRSVVNNYPTYAACNRMRDSSCGPSGLLFEPRRSFWRRLIGGWGR